MDRLRSSRHSTRPIGIENQRVVCISGVAVAHIAVPVEAITLAGAGINIPNNPLLILA
jgi:hypothetical protein